MQQDQFRRELKRTIIPLAVIGLLGCSIGDMARPWGNIALWITAISTIAFVGLLAAYMRKHNSTGEGEAHLPALLTLSAGCILIFALWAFVSAGGPKRGFLASRFQPVANLQTSLFGLQKDVAEVQPGIPDGEQDVDGIATVQAQEFASVQAAYVALRAGQDVVPNPIHPHEWYHNAQIYQLRGDIAGALSAYEGYIRSDREYIDPYLDYIELLKTTEGNARTRQIIEELHSRRPDSATLDLLSAMFVADPQERLNRLVALAEREPNFGPVYYHLVLEYLTRVRQHLTQSQVAPLQEALNNLKRLEAAQDYSRLYIDKMQALESLVEVENLVKSLAEPLSRLKLEFAPSFSADGVYVAVALPDFDVQELRYNVDEPQPITSTGNISNSAAVNTSIGPLPLEKGLHTLYIQYTDGAGVESPVYSYDYAVDDIVVDSAQQPFDARAEGIPVRFSLAVVDGEPDALYTYRYSLDSDTLDQSQQGLGSGTIIQIAPVTTGEHTFYVQATLEGVETKIVQHRFTVK